VLAKINTFNLIGINGEKIDIEIDVQKGKPSFTVVGLPDAAVKESIERVSAAITNSNLDLPQKKMVINLAPADIKKEGVIFDLGIALGILVATGQLEYEKVKDFVCLGELSLDGKLRALNGMLPLLISARECGYKKFIIPRDSGAPP